MIFLNNLSVNITRFPDNTSQVWNLPEDLLSPGAHVEVRWEFSNESEFLQLAQLKTLLDHNNIKASLLLTYLPYGRQDKPVSNASTFALHTFAQLLNSLNFFEIVIIDPHSQVALNLIANSVAKYPLRKLAAILQKFESDLICYPDKGAREKYSKVYNLPQPYIYGEKVREQSTGNIISYRMVGECAGKSVMIVDDLCDGGATFRILAKELLTAGAREVNLFVTHGIFSKGIRTLFESGIKRIFTQDGEVGSRLQSIQF
jgi:ribose-phosphate pyrophosphokinase